MQNRRILSALIAVIMILGILPTFALAASGITVIAANTEISQGTTTASITIKATNNPGIAVLGFKVGYDSDKMTLSSVTAGSDVFNSSDVTAGDISKNPYTYSAFTAEGNKNGNGLLLTLNFTVNANCPAGTYPISLSASEAYTIEENSVDVNLVNGSIKVSQKSITGVTFTDTEFTYDGTEKQIKVKGTLPTGATVDYTNNKGTDAGTYNATAVVKANGYADLSLNAKMTIKPKNLTVSGLTAENKTYDRTTDAVVKGGTLSGKVTGDDVSAIFPTTGTFANANVGSNIAVGIADITLTGSDKGNYTITQPTGLKANITKAPISVKANDITIIQGTTIPTLTYAITGGQLFGTDKITGAPATATNGTKLGTFDITKGTLAVSSNYNLTFTKGTLTVVDKTPQNITVSDITEKTYGDSSFVVTATPDAASQLTAFTFESSNTDVAEIAADGTVTIKTAGETDITVKQAGNDDYAAFEKVQKLIVNKKAITITSINADEKTSVLEGVLAEDTAVTLDYDKLNIEIVGAADDTTSNVTFTNFVLAGDKAANYTITTENVAAVMSNENIVTITITADNGTVTGAGRYIKGSSVTATVTPNSGYNFSGWYVNDTSVSTETSYTFTADADTALVAKFARRSSGGGGGSTYYTVKFDTNDGTKVSDQRIKRNAVAKAPEAPTKDGFTFEGWYTDKELTNEYDFAAKVTKSITLYAKWAEIDKTKNQIILTVGNKVAKVFGEDKANDVAPKIVNDRTMLPARFVAESLGANVEWDDTAPGIVTITKDDVKIVIYIGEEYAVVNGEKVKLDSPAFIENDRTYTPIRFISEELGASVEWLPETQQVVITK